MEFLYLDVWIALAAVFAAGAWLTLKAKLPAALAPLCTLASVSVLLTLAGMAGVLRPAAAALYLLCFALGGWALFDALRPAPAGKAALAGLPGGRGAAGDGSSLRGRWCAAARQLFTPGALVFWLLAVSFTVYFGVRQPLFSDFDEFSLWGTAAKLTSTQNVLYTEGEIGWPWQATQNCGLMTLSYFFQLFGRFAAWKTYVAYDLLLFACFAAVVGGVKWKDYGLAFPMAVVCWLAPFLLTVYVRTLYVCHVYFTSYGDIPAGVVFGGAVAFWLCLRHEGGPFGALLPVLALCANIKSNTFVLSLAAAGIVAVDLVLFGGGSPWRRGLPRRVGRAGAAFAAPMAMYLLWGRYTGSLIVQNAEQGGMGSTSEDLVTVAVNGVKMLLGLPVTDYYEARRARFGQAAADMLDAFVHTKITMLGSGLVVTGVIFCLFALAVLLLPDLRRRLRAALLWLLCAACFLAYNFMLVLSYAFVFTESQGAGLIDYNRYLYTYYLGWFLIALAVLGLAVRQSRRPLWGKAAVLGLAGLCLLCYGRYLSPYTSVLDFDDSEFGEIAVYAEETEAVKQAIGADPARTGPAEQQRVFLVSQGDNGLRWFNFSYEFLPLVLDYSGRMRPEDSAGVEYGAGGGTFGLPELYNGSDYYHAYTADEFLETVLESGCGYLFAEKIDGIFTESYAALFADGLAAAADGPALYRVEADGFVPVTTETGAAE